MNTTTAPAPLTAATVTRLLDRAGFHALAAAAQLGAPTNGLVQVTVGPYTDHTVRATAELIADRLAEDGLRAIARTDSNDGISRGDLRITLTVARAHVEGRIDLGPRGFESIDLYALTIREAVEAAIATANRLGCEVSAYMVQLDAAGDELARVESSRIQPGDELADVRLQFA